MAIISLGEICLYSPAGTNLCPRDNNTIYVTETGPPPTVVLGAATPNCKEPGIRYTGTTPQGAQVCFTLTPDRSMWVEIGFTFVLASACSLGEGGNEDVTGETYLGGTHPLVAPGRIAAEGFTATIRGARASGLLSNEKVCGNKRFKWSASQAP